VERRDQLHEPGEVVRAAAARQLPHVLELEVGRDLVDPPGPRRVCRVRKLHRAHHRARVFHTVPYGSMAVSRTPRSAWIGAALQALAAGGPDAVRVEALARALGATKGSYYWHFANRDALLDGVLDAWERVSVDDVIERIEDGGEDATARSKLAHLGALAASG